MRSTKTTMLRARVDSARKARAERILGRYGLTTGQAINVFLAKVNETNGLPFDLRPTETDELLADPDFRKQLRLIKAGKAKYLSAEQVPN